MEQENGGDVFVTMGSFDGVETCELIAIFLLHKINSQLNGIFGLSRDAGLGAIRVSPRQTENIKKQLCKTFDETQLKITVHCNQKIVDYLDVTSDMKNATTGGKGNAQ